MEKKNRKENNKKKTTKIQIKHVTKERKNKQK